MTEFGTTDRTEPDAGASVEAFFGLMRIGGALLALPVPAIREVIPGEATYSLMPVKAQGLLGAFDIRGTIVPLLDLRDILGLPLEDGDDHVIVIMRWQGHLLGLRAREVCGIARLKAGELFALATIGAVPGQTLATHTFHSGEEIVTLLDAGGITTLPNIPLVAEKVAAKQGVQVRAEESILLFTYGRSHFGIDATCVDATVPAARIERTALTAGFCLGVIDHHGYEVPVVDTTGAIGLGAGTPARETAVVVVRFSADAMLGFAIDTVRDIVRIAQADILAIPSLGTGEASMFRGMISGEGGRQNLLLDADSLRAQPMLKTLAGLRKPRLALQRGQSAAAGRGETAAERTHPFLTYVAGAEHATSLDQIVEILTYPADVAPFELGGLGTHGMLGLFTHRGRVAPLVCLGTLLGHPRAPSLEDARVLFVEHGGNAVGFVVEALRSIEKAVWHSPVADLATRDRSLFKSLVMLGAGDERRMVSHIDLVSEIRLFFSPPAAEPPSVSSDLPWAVSA